MKKERELTISTMQLSLRTVFRETRRLPRMTKLLGEKNAFLRERRPLLAGKNKTGFMKKKPLPLLVAKQSKQDMTKLLGQNRKLSFLSHYTEATSA